MLPDETVSCGGRAWAGWTGSCSGLGGRMVDPRISSRSEQRAGSANLAAAKGRAVRRACLRLRRAGIHPSSLLGWRSVFVPRSVRSRHRDRRPCGPGDGWSPVERRRQVTLREHPASRVDGARDEAGRRAQREASTRGAGRCARTHPAATAAEAEAGPPVPGTAAARGQPGSSMTPTLRSLAERAILPPSPLEAPPCPTPSSSSTAPRRTSGASP
jgi:hypothetical protein